jgi:hypothetical protein
MKMLFTAGLLKSNAEHNGVGLRIRVWLQTAHAKVPWQRRRKVGSPPDGVRQV